MWRQVDLLLSSESNTKDDTKDYWWPMRKREMK
jgi:hypothetical protein